MLSFLMPKPPVPAEPKVISRLSIRGQPPASIKTIWMTVMPR